MLIAVYINDSVNGRNDKIDVTKALLDGEDNVSMTTCVTEVIFIFIFVICPSYLAETFEHGFLLFVKRPLTC